MAVTRAQTVKSHTGSKGLMLLEVINLYLVVSKPWLMYSIINENNIKQYNTAISNHMKINV